jgi:predicted phage baseplate assembly protein
LVHSYRRETVAINANGARATHGESVQEILGSGDAGQSYQQFTLRQPPLTYVSASTPSGAESTLQVQVNDLLWREAPTLYGRSAHEHVFVTRTDDDGKTTIQWGDGATGVRLPSGQDNVRVAYRKGIGLEGLVKAEQLSLLLTRPLGVKEVTNPLPATGAANRESLADARSNAPLTVLTLDRTVSLQDYEDFARAYAGIAKALATWTWEKQTRRVFVTVAGPNGAEVAPGSDLYKNLLTAMQKAGDPYVDFRVKSYRKALFKITGGIMVGSAHQSEKVMTAVEQLLRARFSFEARAFGQPVNLSEVIVAIQTVPGVVAVDVDKLYRTGQAAVLNRRLVAELPKIGTDGEMVAAELLTLDPAPLNELVVKS